MKETPQILELTPASEMVVYAFRYCLGRKTYAVSTCTDYLIAHWRELEPRDQKLIVEEIRKALQDNLAGHECDRKRWQEVLMEAASVATEKSIKENIHIYKNLADR